MKQRSARLLSLLRGKASRQKNIAGVYLVAEMMLNPVFANHNILGALKAEKHNIQFAFYKISQL